MADDCAWLHTVDVDTIAAQTAVVPCARESLAAASPTGADVAATCEGPQPVLAVQGGRAANTEQLSAIQSDIDKPLMILAGPVRAAQLCAGAGLTASTRFLLHAMHLQGSGKTFTLQQRIAHILRVSAAPAHSVCAITFTRSGAQELRGTCEQLQGGPGWARLAPGFPAPGSLEARELGTPWPSQRGQLLPCVQPTADARARVHAPAALCHACAFLS